MPENQQRDYKWLIGVAAIVVTLLLAFAGAMRKAGQIEERLNDVQQQLQQEDHRLERMENMFLAKPGGTP